MGSSWLDPNVKPPPWIQNMTGRFAWSLMEGVHTFRFSISSPAKPSSQLYRNCSSLFFQDARGDGGATGPQASAGRTPAHGVGFRGGMNRFSPAVVSPYGIPLKMKTPSWV